MAAVFLALAVLLQAAPADEPVSTAPKVPTIAPRQAAAAPSVAPGMTGARAAAQPPTDDYGYVAWCYGALDTYLSLYDRVMPEVTRIERAFPGPRGADADLKLYPQMRDQAKKDLLSYRVAITAAEKASPRSIGEDGAVAMRKGRAVWSAASTAKTVDVAREWMGWTPPARCSETAKALTVRSNVLGQALIYNQQAAPPVSALSTPEPAPEPVAPAPAAPAPAVAEAPPEPKAAPVAAAKPVLKPAVAPSKPAAKPATPKTAAGPAPLLPIGAFVIDPDNPRGCPGKIDATVKAGRIVMVCMPA